MDNWIEIGRLLKEIGIAYAAFGLCVWVTIYVIKRMTYSIDKLIERIEKHEIQAEIRGALIKKEHESLLCSMQQTEQALGRINGYKQDNRGG